MTRVSHGVLQVYRPWSDGVQQVAGRARLRVNPVVLFVVFTVRQKFFRNFFSGVFSQVRSGAAGCGAVFVPGEGCAAVRRVAK